MVTMSEINPKNENPKKSCLQSCRSAALERVKISMSTNQVPNTIGDLGGYVLSVWLN